MRSCRVGRLAAVARRSVTVPDAQPTDGRRRHVLTRDLSQAPLQCLPAKGTSPGTAGVASKSTAINRLPFEPAVLPRTPAWTMRCIDTTSSR